jgi:hypothetical protein
MTAATNPGNQREILSTTESASQSGQNRSSDVTSPSNSQQTYAKTRPLLSSLQLLLKRHGECGSRDPGRAAR